MSVFARPLIESARGRLVRGAVRTRARPGGTPTPTPGEAPTTDEPSVTKDGVTFNFASARPVGQYANGDYFVQGPVTITSITPVSEDDSGRWINGAMLNPGNRSYVPESACDFTDSTDRVVHNSHGRIARDLIRFTSIDTTTGIAVDTDYYVVNPTTNNFQVSLTPDGAAVALTNDGTGTYYCNRAGVSKQGWDGYGGSFVYDGSLNIDPGATGSDLVFAEGEEGSVVKIISDGAKASGAQQLPQWMVVLTVVNDIPLEGAFRPGVSADSKASLFFEGDLDYSVLPSEASPISLPYDKADIEAVTSGPYPLHHTQNTGSGQREFMPQNPRPKASTGTISQQEYGSYVGQDFEKGYTLLQLDYSNSEKRKLVVNFVTIAMDVYSRLIEGGVFPAQGAGEGWRKAPLVLAAAMLQDSPNVGLLETMAAQTWRFAEDGQLFIVDAEDVARNHSFKVESPGDESTNRGTGYQVGDVLTITGGDEIQAGKLTVGTVGGSGEITSWSETQTGQWYTGPTNPFPITDGSGSGATAKIRLRERYITGMIGLPDWGESPLTAPIDNGANMDSYYRMSNGNHGVGQALLMRRTTGAKAIWANDIFFDYHDRYFNNYKGLTTGGINQINTLTEALYNAHRWDGEPAATAPVRQGAYADSRFVWVIYDKLLDEKSIPDPSDFVFKVENVTATLDFKKVRGYMVGFKHDAVIEFGNDLTLDYVAGASPVRSIREEDAAGFTGIAVTNTVPAAGAITALDLVDNQNAAWSKVATPSTDTGINRFLVAVRFRLDTVTGGRVLFGGTRSQAFCVMTSGSSIRLQLGGTTVFRHDSSALSAGVTYTAIWAVDFTQTSAAAQGIMYLDSTRQADPGVAADLSGNRTIDIATALPNGLGIFARPTDGGEMVDGGIEWIYTDWGASGVAYTLPDIADPAVRAHFDSDEFLNTDGEGPTGNQPKLFYAGTLAEWNDAAGVSNKGTISSRPAVKQTGDYV